MYSYLIEKGGVKKMPLKDTKGPLGEGPRTGRGLGPCEEGETETQSIGSEKGFGGGYGRGRRGFKRGFGRCHGRFPWFGAGQGKLDTKDKKENLRNYRQELEKELETVKKEEESLK